MLCLHPISVRTWSHGTRLRKLVNYNTGEQMFKEVDQPKASKTNSYHLVPCGKCVACLSRRRNDWTFRLTKEQSVSSYSFFYTLTYNDDQIPIRIQDGKPYFVFNKKHVQDYLKRVRYYLNELNPDLNCRYFLVSEYGSKGLRPHYHMQAFISGDDTLRYYKDVVRILDDNWTYGFASRKNTNAANIHYMTKYCLKSLELQNDRCIDDVFVMCSKKPYIGEGAENLLERTPADQPIVYNHGMKQAMPRIYRNKLGISGFGAETSKEFPNLSLQAYENMYRDYKKKHESFDSEEFHSYINKRLRVFEREATHRQMARLEKL